MESDIAKRGNDKRVNEMKKTIEGRRVLKQLGMIPPAARPVGIGRLGVWHDACLCVTCRFGRLDV